MFAAFYEAVLSGTSLLVIHTVIGDAGKVGPESPETEEMRKRHREGWSDARRDRHNFELAAFEVGLVGSKEAGRVVGRLRVFLESSLYSGEPWRKGYPSANLNPPDIEAGALDLAVDEMRPLGRQLWRAGSDRRTTSG
jgi:hypothetical protein